MVERTEGPENVDPKEDQLLANERTDHMGKPVGHEPRSTSEGAMEGGESSGGGEVERAGRRRDEPEDVERV